MTDRSEHADDGAVPHFSKIKSLWSSGDPQKIATGFRCMGMLLKNMFVHLSTKANTGDAYLPTTGSWDFLVKPSSTLSGPGVVTSFSMQHAQPSVLRGVLGDRSLRQKQLPNWATEVSRPHTSPSRQLSLLALRAPFSAV
jgi:hypothetical protein